MSLAIDKDLSRDVLKLASPVILGMLSQTSVNIADTIIIGYMDDEVASVAGVAAVGITLPLFWAVGGFLSALAIGTQALTARRFGEGRPQEAGRVLFNSLSIALLFGLLASIIGALWVPKIFPFFNSDPTVLKYGIPYAQMRFIGVLSMVATFSFKSFFDGIGKTYVHMVASIVMNIANILLNIALVFGKWGFPEMGVVGSGLGTMIASYMGLFIMVLWAVAPSLRAQYRFFSFRNLDGSILREITRLSLPAGLVEVFIMTGFLLFLKIVGMIDHAEWLATFPQGILIELHSDLNQALSGSAALDLTGLLNGTGRELDALSHSVRAPLFTAGTKIIIDLMSLSFMIALAVGTATATLVSQNLGRNDPKLAERYVWEAVKLASYLLGVVGALEALFPHFFLSIFTNKYAVIQATALSLRMVGLITFLIGAGLIFTQALFGAGDAKFVMYVQSSLHAICLVPLSYLFGILLNLKMEGVWLAGVLYIISLASILFWKFRQGKWKYIKI